jgi:hypothetical protein
MGVYNIFGVFWYQVGSETPVVSRISGTQSADVYNLAPPGEQRKPYSAAVVDLLNQADAIDWSTHTFKVDKLSVIQEITAQHGDGLNAEQLAAISVCWFCPFICNPASHSSPSYVLTDPCTQSQMIVTMSLKDITFMSIPSSEFRVYCGLYLYLTELYTTQYSHNSVLGLGLRFLSFRLSPCFLVRFILRCSSIALS